MNLAILRRSRPSLEAGDVFAMQPPVDGYLFGRVIDLHANVFGTPNEILIYIYSMRSIQKRAPQELRPDRLLVPPVITNRLPWTRGYFEHLEHRQLRASDRLQRHCFEDGFGHYFDETGTQLATPVEPVGSWGLSSFRSIDDSISRALGIPLSPNAEKAKPTRKRLPH
jgi:hypothetical protein